MFSPANSFSSVSGKTLTPPSTTCSRETQQPFGHPAGELARRLGGSARVVEHDHARHDARDTSSDR